jgi:hypothetical protein
LKQEARAYRRFYLKVINRYFGMLRARESFYGFLEEHAADYPAIVADPHAIVETNGSEPLTP